MIELFVIILQMGNHDKSRVGSRLGTDRIDLTNILLMTLPGVSVSYNVSDSSMYSS